MAALGFVGKTPAAMHAAARLGPLADALGALAPEDWAAWDRAAAAVTAALGAKATGPRVHQLTLPLYFWILTRVRRAPRRPLMVGLSAPQGAGKSTVVDLLLPLFADAGLTAVGVSVDDFYLRHEQQRALAAANPGNPYLEHRGYPGTHDVPLGAATLDALALGRPVALPRYDKSAHGGRGDRAPHTTPVAGPVDLVVLDGWMLGFSAPPTPSADPHLAAIDAALPAYQAWHRHLDVLIAMRAADPTDVLRWRTEAEDARRARGEAALSPQAVADYVRRFLPAYERYADTVRAGPWRGDQLLAFTLGADRLPRQLMR